MNTKQESGDNNNSGPPSNKTNRRTTKGDSRSTKIRSRTLNHLIRKAIDRTCEIAALSPQRRKILAVALGISDPTATAKLAYASLTPKTGRRGAVVALIEMKDAATMKDNFEVGIRAMKLTREQLIVVWKLLGLLGATNKKSLPGNDVQAALAVSKAVSGLDGSLLDDVAAVVDMIKLIWKREANVLPIAETNGKAAHFPVRPPGNAGMFNDCLLRTEHAKPDAGHATGRWQNTQTRGCAATSQQIAKSRPK